MFYTYQKYKRISVSSLSMLNARQTACKQLREPHLRIGPLLVLSLTRDNFNDVCANLLHSIWRPQDIDL